MATIHNLLNDNYDDLVPDSFFVHGYNTASLPASSVPEDWGQEYWSEDLALEHQSWDDICNGLFISDSQQEVDSSPGQFAEYNIQNWAAEELSSTQYASTPALTVSGTSGEESSQSPAQQVCYGMIYRTASRLSGEMSTLDSKLRAPDVSRIGNNYLFSIRPSPAHLALCFTDGDEFAILNTQISKVLLDILDLPSIHFEVLADGITVRDTVRAAKKASEATVRVNINVYGSPDIRTVVARLFSEHKIWLQHPDCQRPGSVYDNPQIVDFPDVPLSHLGGPDAVPISEDMSQDKQEKFQQSVSDVYASLKRNSRLKNVEGDSRLTPLLEHQKTALDFMLQRENGPIEPEFSLWEPDHSDGEEGFSHVITKSKCRVKPPETGGGILADEMGMGKSLSILALIMKTLDGAHTWQCGDDTALADLRTDEGPELTPSRATLILVPSALLLREWQAEIRKHTQESFKITVYHGRNRDRAVAQIEDSDIVLSTYQTIAIESPVDSQTKRSPLLDFAWFRIVLDEAHIIRRRTTTFYDTVSRLLAKSRWCLTGTPIQNRLEDIGNLFAVIRAYPFDKINLFRHFIASPFEYSRTHDRASENLGRLIDSVCLRRSRGLLDLPSQKERLRELVLNDAERDQYELTKQRMSRRLQQGRSIDRKDHSFGQFHVQLQLRILCNHGTFQSPYSWMYHDLQIEREDMFYLRSGYGTKEVKCSLCAQSMPYLSTNQVYRTFTSNCAHKLCDDCLEIGFQDEAENHDIAPLQCPICEPAWKDFSTHRDPQAPNHGNCDEFVPTGESSKMKALTRDILDELNDTKSIVFSCWTKTLDLIAKHLQAKKIKFGRIDGASAVSHREQTLHEFENSNKTRVLIMTTGTGAFGLNLASANRIFIVEPQWNPSIENQAIARALRLGQTQEVQITRYIVKDTVEMAMRSQQARKIKMASLADLASTN